MNPGKIIKIGTYRAGVYDPYIMFSSENASHAVSEIQININNENLLRL
jgi:hypothetical protein